MANSKSIQNPTNKFVELNEKFIAALKRNGFELAENAVCRVTNNVIYIGIFGGEIYENGSKSIAFASEVEFYAKHDDEYDFFNRKNEINFGTTGVFDPSNQSSYWRTIHAASLLKNFGTASELVNLYCKEFEALRKEIASQEK